MHDQSGEMVYVTSNDVRVYVQLLPNENGSFFCNHVGRLTFVGSFKRDLFLCTRARYIITMGIKETFFTIVLYKELTLFQLPNRDLCTYVLFSSVYSYR